MKQPPLTLVLERLTAIYIGCMLTLYLLFPGLGGNARLTGSKWGLFLLLTLAYLGAAGLLGLEMAVIGRARPPRADRLWHALTLLDKLLLGFWAWSLLATLCSIDFHRSLWGGERYDGLITLTLCCFSALLIAHFGRPRPWMLWLLGGALCLNGALCLLQLAGGNPLGLYPEGMDYYDAGKLYAGAFLGTLGNVDVMAAVLAAAIPALWLALARLEGRRRLLPALPLALCLAVLAGSRVAGGLLGAFGGVLFTLPFLPRSGRGRRAAAAAVALFCAGALVLLYLFGGRLGGFFYEATEVLHGRWRDEFGSSRVFIWRHVLELAGEHPLLGGGPATLGLRMEVGFQRYDEALGMVIRSSIDDAHNIYLNILVNQGLPALLFYLAMLGRAAAGWLRAAAGRPAVLLCGGAVLGYSIQAFFGISSPVSAPYFWIALGLLARCLSGPAERQV